jgi:hypothetical protein
VWALARMNSAVREISYLVAMSGSMAGGFWGRRRRVGISQLRLRRWTCAPPPCSCC